MSPVSFDDFAFSIGLREPGLTDYDDDTRVCVEYLDARGYYYKRDYWFANAKEIAQRVALERIAARSMDGRW